MLRKVVVVSAVFLALSPLAASAQGQGSAADRRACTGPAKRFCRAVLSQGDMAVYSCLQQNAARIGAKCRRVIGVNY
jgi:hypothetical protein